MGVRMDDWIIHDPLVVDVKQLQWLTVHYRERVETFEYVKWVCEHLHSRHLRVLYEAGVHVHTWHVCAAIMKNPCMCMAQACVDILDLNTLDGYDREGYAPLHRAIMVNSPGLIARIVERGCAIKADMVGMKCSEIAAWHCSAYVTSTLQLIEEVPLELNASMRVVCADALRNAYIDTSV